MWIQTFFNVFNRRLAVLNLILFSALPPPYQSYHGQWLGYLPFTHKKRGSNPAGGTKVLIFASLFELSGGFVTLRLTCVYMQSKWPFKMHISASNYTWMMWKKSCSVLWSHFFLLNHFRFKFHIFLTWSLKANKMLDIFFIYLSLE